MELFLDVVQETIIDSIKLLPFLFVTYLVMEYIEHKFSNKSKEVIKKSGKFGYVIGALLGAVPQCGFSVVAANFYAARMITLGTLVSIFLSTSDEMLPILISNGAGIEKILGILVMKIVIGMLVGFFVDLLLRKKEAMHIEDMCQEEHCHCENSLLKSAFNHTLHIFIYIVIISFVLNLTIGLIGEDTIKMIFSQNMILGPMVAAVIGIIPNCASSVILTELYLSNVITLRNSNGWTFNEFWSGNRCFI